MEKGQQETEDRRNDKRWRENRRNKRRRGNVETARGRKEDRGRDETERTGKDSQEEKEDRENDERWKEDRWGHPRGESRQKRAGAGCPRLVLVCRDKEQGTGLHLERPHAPSSPRNY